MKMMLMMIYYIVISIVIQHHNESKKRYENIKNSKRRIDKEKKEVNNVCKNERSMID